jgi:hypothetical protein
MEQVLTLDEIKARFDSEWVLLDEPQASDALQVRAGKVLHHSKDRDEVYRKAVELKPKHFAVLYTGTGILPPGTEIVI